MLHLEQRALNWLALAFGLALWVPALGLPVSVVTLQPMDILVLVGIPLIIVFRRALPGRMAIVLLLLIGSFCLSLWVGGSPAIFAYYGVFIVPFLLQTVIICRFDTSLRLLMIGFIVGGILSGLLFAAQMLLGAEDLDFRTNVFFQLPPHYGRGFAIFPEVSTFACHFILLLGVFLIYSLAPATDRGSRPLLLFIVALMLAVLMLTRSSSLLLVAPMVVSFAVYCTTRPTLNGLLITFLLTAVAALVLSTFLAAFFGEQLESASASRSAAIRLSSVIGGVSVLGSGEVFGVGLGNNDLVQRRAFDATRGFGLSNRRLPTGVNSLVVGRIFEEGWPALVQLLYSLILLIKAARRKSMQPIEKCLLLIGFGSLLISFFVIGYRGIYANWLWLAVPVALLAGQHQTQDSSAKRGVCAA